MDLMKHANAWCAIYVRHKHEFMVAALLVEKGYSAFSPWYSARRAWSDRCKEVRLPLFSGYVFCQIKAEKAPPILLTPGVIRIVGTSTEPSIIPDSEIQAIQSAVSSGYKFQPCEYVEVGSRVRIASGPLAGIEGIVESHRNHHSLVLTVQLVRRSIVVELGKQAFFDVTSCSTQDSPSALIHSNPN